MAQEFTFTVNGVEHTTTREQTAAALPARRPAHSLRQGRLLRGRLRHLHHPCGRCGRQGVRADHRSCRRPQHRDRRGPARGRARGLCVRLWRRGRRAVRFLHPRHGHGGCGAHRRGPRAHRGADQVRHPRQRLPLHRLQKDYRGHLAGRCGAPRRKADRRGPGARR